MVDRTTSYARAVVAGEIVAGELLIAACQRHLDDLVHGPSRGLEWRPDTAEEMIDAYPRLFSITDGPNAGQPFELLDWMLFVTGSLFGWYRDGRWRFDFAYIETAKGQGKSPWIGCTAILMTGALGRQRAQVYAVAPKEEQARVMFADAVAAIQSQRPSAAEGITLESQGEFLVSGRGVNANKIQHPRTKSVFRTTGGNASRVSGPRPTAVFVDEVHELVSRALIDMWQAALAKSAEGGMMVLCTNTPAQTQFTGTYYAEMAIRVATGRDVNDGIFALLTRVDVADRDAALDDESCWSKAMPALGITFPWDNVRREVAKAKLNPSEAARVKRLYLGIPTGAVDFWLEDPSLWDAAIGTVDAELFVNAPCWLALDLSDKHDLTSLTAAWLVDGHLYCKAWYWTVRANLERRARADQMPYDLWETDGQLSVVEGASIDKEFIAAKVAELFADHKVEFLAYDAWQMFAFEEACAHIGLATWRYEGPDQKAGRGMKLVAHSQGTRIAFQEKQLCMPRSIEALEDLLRTAKITIDDNPITYACAANAAPITDAVGNRAFDKRRSRGRIDGLVTLAMVAGAAAMNAQAKGPSIYTKRGILTL